MTYLKRKADAFLSEWKERDHFPLLVKGARQVGKTETVKRFGEANYESFVYVNFVEQPKFKTIIGSGYDAESVVREMSNLDAKFRFVPYRTLIVFDEIQEFPDIATTLKFFKIDGRYDVITTSGLRRFLSDIRKTLKCIRWILRNSCGQEDGMQTSLK